MRIVVVKKEIALKDVSDLANELYGDMIKAVADIEKNIMALGGEFHADAEAVLLEQGSSQKDLWGLNIYPAQSTDTWLEYVSLINIRPHQGNKSQEIEDENIRKYIAKLTQDLIKR